MPKNLFGEPAWDILLDLYASEVEGRQVSISSACVASSVPATTALRWLNTLADSGLVARAPDGSDARRSNLELTPLGRSSLRRWIQMALLERRALDPSGRSAPS
jgi:DNA-binding MarR family transcriptional regulator